VLNYSDPQLDDEANTFGRKFRDKLQVDGERTVYTNFATGDEESRTLYGSEERVENLRKLKREWDPKGVFAWYNPVR
jgi:fumiquinazoline A oxidase